MTRRQADRRLLIMDLHLTRRYGFQKMMWPFHLSKCIHSFPWFHLSPWGLPTDIDTKLTPAECRLLFWLENAGPEYAFRTVAQIL